MRINHAFSAKTDVHVIRWFILATAIGAVGCMTAKGVVGKVACGLITVASAFCAAAFGVDYGKALADEYLEGEEVSE